MRLIVPLRRTAAVLALTGVILGARQDSPPVAADPLERIAMAGASATAGFSLETMFGGPGLTRMARFLPLALSEPVPASLDVSDVNLYRSPKVSGAGQLDRVGTFKPSLTLAIDLPFWFIHGGHGGDESRRKTFEWLLERLDGPQFGTLVLGTIPKLGDDVALWMVPRSMRANDDLVAWANTRLADWSTERKHVVVVPLAEYFKGIHQERDLVVHGQTIDGGDTEEFLQSDGLHPTAMGMAAFMLLTLDHLNRHFDGALEERVNWDLEDLQDAFEDASETD